MQKVYCFSLTRLYYYKCSFQTILGSKLNNKYLIVLAPNSELNGCSELANIMAGLAHVR